MSCILTCCLEPISDFQGSSADRAEFWHLAGSCPGCEPLMQPRSSQQGCGNAVAVHEARRDTHRRHSSVRQHQETLGCPGGRLSLAPAPISAPQSWCHCNYGKMLDKHQLRTIPRTTDQGSQVLSGAGEAGVSVCSGHQSKSPFTG